MPVTSRSETTQFLSRFECKYLVSRLVVPQMREFLRPFMQPDRYGARADDPRYRICSLYLDTEDLRLYQQTVGGEKNRFKLRVRTYSDDPDAPAFFEIKRKVDSIVNKSRTKMPRDQARALLRRGLDGWIDGVLPVPGRIGSFHPGVGSFFAHVALAAAKPVVRVKYVREAYESVWGDPVRATFDTELMHTVTLDDNLSHAEGRWVSTPVEGVIFEVKFTERYPAWIRDLVHTFGLKQQPVPKYIMSIDHLLMGGREAALSLAGFQLPPHRA